MYFRPRHKQGSGIDSLFEQTSFYLRNGLVADQLETGLRQNISDKKLRRSGLQQVQKNLFPLHSTQPLRFEQRWKKIFRFLYSLAQTMLKINWNKSKEKLNQFKTKSTTCQCTYATVANFPAQNTYHSLFLGQGYFL